MKLKELKLKKYLKMKNTKYKISEFTYEVKSESGKKFRTQDEFVCPLSDTLDMRLVTDIIVDRYWWENESDPLMEELDEIKYTILN